MGSCNECSRATDTVPVACGMRVPPGERGAGLRGEGTISFAHGGICICVEIETLPGCFAAAIVSVVIAILCTGACTMVVVGVLGLGQSRSDWAAWACGEAVASLFVLVWVCSTTVLARKLRRHVSVEVPCCGLGILYQPERRIAFIQLPDTSWIAIRAKEGRDAELLDRLSAFYGRRATMESGGDAPVADAE